LDSISKNLVDNGNHTDRPGQTRVEIADHERRSKEQHAESNKRGEMQHDEDVGKQTASPMDLASAVALSCCVAACRP